MLHVFYQMRRRTCGMMLSQTHSLYVHRNRQNVVRSQSYNFHHIQSITTPSILSILHLILLLCVLSDEENMCHDALSDSQLVRASELVEPGTFSFAIMFKLYGGSLACSAPTLAPILYKCINADVCCLCIRRFGSTRSSCAGRRFSTRS